MVDREFHDEWRTLTDQARFALEAGGWSMRLGIFPPFADARVVGLVAEPRKPLSIEARCWHRAIDAEKLRTPVERVRHPRPLQPTVGVCSTTHWAQDMQKRLLSDLAQLRMPPVRTGWHLALDGTWFTIFCTSYAETLLFSGVLGGAVGWEPLLAWTASTWDTLVQALRAEHPNEAWLRSWNETIGRSYSDYHRS